MLRKSDEAYTRLVNEQKELSEKIEKLYTTIQGCRRNKRNDISLDELHLLEDQLKYMIQYNTVLNIRIHRVEGW